MTPDQGKPPRESLKEDLGRTADCIGLARLDGPLTDAERSHVAACVRCQTELAMYAAFRDSTPVADDEADVAWVASEVRRRAAREPVKLTPKTPQRILSNPGWRPVAIAASALLAVTLGYVAWDREPAIRDSRPGTDIYRTEQVRIVGPSGDLPAAPAELAWVAVPGAARYDVSVLEVDRSPLWRGTSPVPRIALPDSVIGRFVAGKTVIWEVSALDRTSTVIAVSGEQRFRVTRSP